MNEELKDALKTQGERVRNAVKCAETTKSALETFDAVTRNAVKAGGIPPGWTKAPTDDDAKSLVLGNEARKPLVAANIEAKAAAEGIEADTKCLLAQVSLVCAETAAMSRISQ